MIVAILALSASAIAVEPADVTDDHVRDAIEVITAELYRRRDPQRFWDPPAWNPDRDGQQDQAGGYTPLVVLALLHAGESYQEPRIIDAVDHLRETTLRGTYAIALRTHVWAMLPDGFREPLDRDLQWLLDAFQPEVNGWSYGATGRWNDNSLAHYGALALWEAAKRQLPVGRTVWQRVEQRYLDNQHDDGGWSYDKRQPVSGSMTAAGLTTLFITQDYLHARHALTLGERETLAAETAITDGLAWMDRHFTTEGNPGKDTYFYYYLYGVERVGLASGYSTFGGRDWFRGGVAAILDRLCTVDGDTIAVKSRLTGARSSPSQTRQLAFALLFLSRGRVPVAFGKLRVPGVAWNNRPRDVANLTRWITNETEQALSWQIVDLDDDPDDWPGVLYFASHEAIPAERLQTLRHYLDRGGLWLCVAEGRGNAFARSIEAAAKQMYPDLKWRSADRDHWSRDLHFEARGRKVPVRVLSNGVRDLIVLVPAMDLPAALQVRETDRVTAWTTPAHAYLYASEMNQPRPRLDTLRPAIDPVPITITRARYDGNWNPEPAAWPAFAASIGATCVDVPLADIGSQDLVVLTGIDAYTPTPAELKTLRDFDGVVLIETPGGRGEFTRSMEAAIGGELRPVSDHPIVEGLSRVTWRPYTRAIDTTPRLRAVHVDGDPRFLFSREDITHALLDRPCWGIAGYSPDSARAMMLNLARWVDAR